MNPIRVLAMLEADSMTGSAKAVLEFVKEATIGQPDLPQIKPSVVVFSRGERENGLAATIRGIGVPFHVVTERGRFDTRVIAQLRELTETQHADVIWSNSVKSHFLVRWAGLNRSRAWVAFHHGYTTTDIKMRIYNQLDRWSLQVADRVLTSSAAFVNELERQAVRSARIHVQHMPIRPFVEVSEERKRKLRAELGLNDRTKLLLTIGRLSKEKGHTDLVKTFPKIRELVGSVPLRLVIVGEGPERPRIEKLCRKLGLTDEVTLVGHQRDPSAYYAIADVFVLPSHTEGSPNVLLEAMASGVPIVATAVGGIPEIAINGKDALLVGKHDRVALACETARLLEDQTIRNCLVSSAREIVLRKTPEAYFRSIASVFSSVLQSRQRSDRGFAGGNHGRPPRQLLSVHGSKNTLTPENKREPSMRLSGLCPEAPCGPQTLP